MVVFRVSLNEKRSQIDFSAHIFRLDTCHNHRPLEKPSSPRWVIPCESAPLESIHCAGKFPSIPILHAIEAYGFLAGFSMCFSLDFDNALRWVFNRSSLGFHKGPIRRFSQLCCRFFAGFLKWVSLGFCNGFRWVLRRVFGGMFKHVD